ncbi:hypothetical protein G6F35_019149 [Rhizopus arrhizus]|nr:hypothetical protein G6F35_019149 [Rhizopus arrhizus]
MGKAIGQISDPEPGRRGGDQGRAPLSALKRPCGRTVMVLSPSMNCQVSVPCIRASCAASSSGASGAPCAWMEPGLASSLP